MTFSQTIARRFPVETDGTTTTGTGLPGDPIVAVGGGGSAVVDGETITGTGTILDPFVAPPNFLDISLIAKGGDPTGVANSASAMLSAISSARAAGRRVYVPAGSYKLNLTGTVSGRPYGVLVPAGEALAIVGDGATVSEFIYDPTSHFALLFETGGRNVSVSDVSFTADHQENSELVNNKSSMYFVSDWDNVNVERCVFNWCSAVATASDSMAVGRFTFRNNRVLNATGGIAGTMFSNITGNYFINDQRTGTRSHPIYIYGPATDCVIANNHFYNADKNCIQIRAGTARYRTKHGFVIANNTFTKGTIGLWLGADEDTNTGGFTVTGNHFKDMIGIVAQGCRNSTFSGNTAEYTWEFGNQTTATAAFSFLSGGPDQSGHTNDARGLVVQGNNLITSHPWFGIIDLLDYPVDGDTVVVGARTYTWRNTATLSGEVEIAGSIAGCVNSLSNEIVGRGLTPMNRVLRGETDCVFSAYPYKEVGSDSLASTARLVVVSGFTFAISSTSPRVTVTAVRDNRYPWYPISATWCFSPVIQNNTCVDFGNGGGMQIDRCISPIVKGNVMPGSTITGRGNVFSTYEDNRFPRTEVTPQYAGRQLRVSDGFTVMRNNDIYTEQEFTTLSLMGSTGTVAVGDGKAKTLLFYGSETVGVDVDEPHSLPFRWADGDEVYLDNGVTQTAAFYFKRSAPDGVTQFNDADGLIALINATGIYTAAYVDFVDFGDTEDPELMIEIKLVAQGTAGNSHRLYITRYTTPDRQEMRTCGQVLSRRDAAAEFATTTFMGGSASLNKTVVFSRQASDVGAIGVVGYDATSHALVPAVFRADVVPGVGFTITHGVATGTESFVFRVDTP